MKAVVDATMFTAITYVRVEGKKTHSVLDVVYLSEHRQRQVGAGLQHITGFSALHKK